MGFKLTSSAFKHNETIPSKFTCEGENISPLLEWTGPPVGTKSFVLIVDDPDAPLEIWYHWIVYNIPPEVNKLEEGIKLFLLRASKEKTAGGKKIIRGHVLQMESIDITSSCML